MKQNILTILIPINDGQDSALDEYLRADIDPDHDQATQSPKCKSDMPFDEVDGLHFASILILREKTNLKGPDALPPLLLIEITFDGNAEEFLDVFIDRTKTGLCRILGHCVGCPVSAEYLPDLIKQYLLRHDVGYNIFYSGHPGRAVCSILNESRLQQAISKYLKDAINTPGRLAESYQKIQQQVQRYIVFANNTKRHGGQFEDYSWVTDQARVPFAVKYGRMSIKFLAFFFFIIASFWLLRYSGFDVQNFSQCVMKIKVFSESCLQPMNMNWIGSLIAMLFFLPANFGDWIFSAIADPIKWIPESAQYLVLLLAVWGVFRFLQFCFSFWENSENSGASWVFYQAVRAVIRLLKWTSLAVLWGLAFILFAIVVPGDYGLTTPFARGFSIFLSILALSAAWFLLSYIKTLPGLAEEEIHGALLRRNIRSLVIDGLKILMLSLVWLIAVNVNWIFEFIESTESADYLFFVTGLVFLVTTALLWAFVLGVVFLVWLSIYFLVEILYDQRKYLPTDILCQQPTDSKAFRREGHGNNKVQNHLISLSRIKGGPVRRLHFRFVLFAINLICRYWYNRGDLGGIPNIHFLRWVIIGKGKYLLFADNYHGSWQGYLDAFIDGGAVKGLNAIWSHTFLNVDGVDKPVGFPLTAFLFWKGARNERPFKEIVRASQPETLAWYSAYQNLSGDNIHANQKIRNKLFKTMKTTELDRLSKWLS